MSDIRSIETKAGSLPDASPDAAFAAPPPAAGRAHDEFVAFMQNRATCQACRVLEKFGKAGSSSRLHVVVADEHLVVTEADDLHQPGRTISGRRVVAFPGATIFRLVADPAPDASRTRHRAAAGVAVLTATRQGRRLIVSGVVEGSSCEHERICDAVELRL